MNGVGDNLFAPNVNLTRAMMWTMLARQAGVDTATGKTWDEAGQMWAMEKGVSDGTHATAAISREQLITMLWRYVGEPVATGDLAEFADAGKIHSWARDAMVWAVAEGIMEGNGDGTLNPTGLATRAEVAQIFLNYFGK